MLNLLAHQDRLSLALILITTILETARQRAADVGMKNVEFITGDARTLTS